MCEKPKQDSAKEPAAEKAAQRSYYYDDAHGYEEFDPETEEADDPDAEEESA